MDYILMKLGEGVKKGRGRKDVGLNLRFGRGKWGIEDTKLKRSINWRKTTLKGEEKTHWGGREL